jgi:hypothetical protein
MNRAILALMLLVPAGSVVAQYGPPARDLRDAVKMLQETQRLIEPAIAAVRDDTAVLNAIAKAEKQLKNAQPMSSLDDATKVLNEFEDHRNAVEPAISRDLARVIESARRIIAEGRATMNAAAAREKLHHDVVHPLQRQVMRNVDQLQQLVQQLNMMAQRSSFQAVPEALNAVGYASTDAP